MEESIPKPAENNNQINSNSAEEENPLAFISSDYFLGSEPELASENRKRKRKRRSRSLEKANKLAKNETIDNSSDENMVGKFGNNLLANATLTLAKSSVKVKKTRPNYFLSVRLNSKGIQEKFNEFFNYVSKKSPEYNKMLINPQQIHITLFVLHLGNEDSIGNAKNCLLTSKDIMKDSCPNYKPSLHFQGIDVFNGGRVVYTTPKNNDDLVAFTKLTYALHEKFQREGFVNNDIKKEFKPHVTLMKLRRKTIIKHNDGKKKEVIKRILPEVYEHFKGFDFGTHYLESVELSSMLLPKGDDGYYARLGNIEF
ncbi:LigT-like protein [Rhizophagus irregularis]|uniref:LigT-like protein n=1 Tax=Rhizophagus irregularis TaxID=588596 RepID=A0A2I1FXA4_9GLOM|nr:LigT-like protein [Rhizophagus irregularis]